MAAPVSLDLMTATHKFGIDLTFSLQNGMHDFEDFFVGISAVFDPKFMYLIFSPLLYGLNPSSGIKLLWVAAVAEWLNHVMKWILKGERPYWWVHENEDLWANNTSPKIHQFSNSCETGPGSPSGHVMVTGACLFIFFSGILQLNRQKGRLVPLIGWSVYAVTTLLVATSRVYIAAHFPHQCLAGLISGLLLGYWLEKVTIVDIKLATHLIMMLGMLFSALALYFCLLGLKMDPNWTLSLATRWCLHREWLHVNTTPFFVMWRYMGTLLGIALTVSSPFYYRNTSRTQTSWIGSFLVVALGTPVSLMTASLIPTSLAHVEVVYLIAFLVHAMIPFLVMGLVKWVVCTKLIHSKHE